ncbi:DUF397 domain-containing protein [Streptomyces jumonjinensis]|uniref:DUF397 domain-containing protein n=1 Tax=Streptomyces jumonjinensis TaxID=1945 RepID=UPI002B1FF281|nr:DUF397 domain-containing protein [Streptomyces jumonjinensis]
MTVSGHHAHASSNGGDCVEAAANPTATGVVPVRDSKRPNGPVLTVSPSAWTGLVALARSSDI